MTNLVLVSNKVLSEAGCENQRRRTWALQIRPERRSFILQDFFLCAYNYTVCKRVHTDAASPVECNCYCSIIHKYNYLNDINYFWKINNCIITYLLPANSVKHLKMCMFTKYKCALFSLCCVRTIISLHFVIKHRVSYC